MPVYGGDPHEVPVAASQKVKVFLPRGSGERLQGKIVFDGPLVAPIRKGTAIARLTQAERESLHLRSKGFRYREMAEILGLSTTTVAETLYRVIEKLAREINE